MGIIKTKKDAKAFVKKEGEFSFTKPDYHGMKWVVIGRDKQGYYILERGQGWRDSMPSYLSEDEMIDFVWKNRKWINREIKERERLLPGGTLSVNRIFP